MWRVSYLGASHRLWCGERRRESMASPTMTRGEHRDETKILFEITGECYVSGLDNMSCLFGHSPHG